MVLLIKNKVASSEDVAHLSPSAAGRTPSGRLAKRSIQSLRNAGVPKAKSLPHINFLAENGSLRAQCAAVLNADLHKLKPREVIVRKVKSAKADLRQLFDSASLKRRFELTKGASDSTCTELAFPTTISNAGTASSLGSLPSLVASVHAFPDECCEVEDYIHRLTASAQSWLDFERLFPQRRAISDRTIDEARHDFCKDLIHSLSDRSSTASPPQAPQSSSHLADSPSFHPIYWSPECSPAPSAASWTDQTTVTFHRIESTAQEKLTQSPEFSDEELRRECDNFSFHSSEEEEWTSEVESREQNAINRALSDMKRKLATPIPRLSSYFSDDSLADTAAQQTLVNPQPTSPDVFSQKDDKSSSYSADQEDEAEQDESFSLSITPLDSPACTAKPIVDAAIIPTSPADVSLSCQMEDATSDEKQDVLEPTVEDDTENVWEVLDAYVPRLLTRISEESLADKYEIEGTATLPPLSFRRPISQYRGALWSRRHCTSIPDHKDHVNSTLAAPLEEVAGSCKAASLIAGAQFATTTDVEDGPNSSSVVNSGKTLRRVRNFVDLKNPGTLPTVQSASSIGSIYETIFLHKEGYPAEPPVRRLRRVRGCLNLRKAVDGAGISLEILPDPYTISEYYPQEVGRRFNFEERRHSSDLEEASEVQFVSPRLHVRTRRDSTKPPIPSEPAGFHLHKKRLQPSDATTEGPSSLCSGCDPSSPLPLWSCAKITRSKEKRGRPLGESTRALKKRLESIRIHPETIHGHSPLRRREELPPVPSISDCRETKSKNIEKLKKMNVIFALRPLPWIRPSS